MLRTASFSDGKTPARLSQLALFILFSTAIQAQAADSFLTPPAAQAARERLNEQQNINQQDRQRALEQQLAPQTPDVRLQTANSFFTTLQFPQEENCFALNNIQLDGKNDFPSWLRLPLQSLANQAQGHCLGSQGVNLLMSALQNRLIDHGYVTSRVMAPPQNLKSGTLRLTLMPGKIRDIKLSKQSDSYVQLYNALPARKGEMLDLRDIEQGLENLQRVPTVQADMAIVPGEQPGESDIEVSWKQQKHWRIGATLDDSGTKSTGRYQGGLTFYLDNPFSLSDLFYISGNHDLQPGSDKGSKSYVMHYSVPFGYWMAGVTASGYDYNQNVAGLNEDYRYSGNSQNLNFQLSRVLYRSTSQKTSVSYEILTREAKNFINDTEVDVQRRKTSAWRVGLQHRHYLGDATFDGAVSYQHGTRWFGAIPAQEESFDEGTALAKIIQLNAQLDLPFELFGQTFRYNAQYLRQINHTRLTPQDQLSLGNRWTVRGFDGERTLIADHGWFVRNDLGWRTPLPNQELYIGADYGEVGGGGSEYLVGKHLAGGVIGLRGNAFSVGYDLFAGVPFSKPDGFSTSPVTLGFNLSWQY
ncbi:ShlB/FhaC/HecB family hemolysin secretion/activation protein [Winslowiella iniecta]|uniref:ShlB/FhaC/HecB family hemolysin secretion/activation protein n=1 Tax=Winslowiella iniecta TaxID=1560201 RepID=A0A0L7THZ9_9GAMM|nr:ShlB/FhaC/HecB family hemolysin secretion/activation protein [Winslowiella iniecta]KOC91855.1 ShlB/FhaC/HecB family hemolysin secretion/activation protein [Winslowiella iniecta]KOC95018.1 ShlB/FhaC/HecB family hemolysin secretion/activation protein [Winslowiella iniecta]